jgi:hypothetical protein
MYINLGTSRQAIVDAYNRLKKQVDDAKTKADLELSYRRILTREMFKTCRHKTLLVQSIDKVKATSKNNQFKALKMNQSSISHDLNRVIFLLDKVICGLDGLTSVTQFTEGFFNISVRNEVVAVVLVFWIQITGESSVGHLQGLQLIVDACGLNETDRLCEKCSVPTCN